MKHEFVFRKVNSAEATLLKVQLAAPNHQRKSQPTSSRIQNFRNSIKKEAFWTSRSIFNVLFMLKLLHPSPTKYLFYQIRCKSRCNSKSEIQIVRVFKVYSFLCSYIYIPVSPMSLHIACFISNKGMFASSSKKFLSFVVAPGCQKWVYKTKPHLKNTIQIKQF